MKKFILGTIISVTALESLALGQPGQVANAKGYQVVSSKSYKATPYHNASTETAYMWNTSHTKKLHNLKNFPNTNWYATKTVTMQFGRSKAVYFKVTSGNNKNSGYVWHGYLTPGKHPVYPKPEPITMPNGAIIPASAIDPSLNAQLLSLFPGTIPNKTLQKVASAWSLERPARLSVRGDFFFEDASSVLGDSSL